MGIASLLESAAGRGLVSCYTNSGDLFICTKCYKRLSKLDRAKKHIESLKEEIHTIFSTAKQRVKRHYNSEDSQQARHDPLAKVLKFDDTPTTCSSSSFEPPVL